MIFIPTHNVSRKVRMRIVLAICTILLALGSFCAKETVSDADGNVYPTVRIGKQVWTAVNLRTTKFNDGTPIPHTPDSVAWHTLTSPGYCYYGNTIHPDSIRLSGALYNWYCVETEKLAPQGWHVATNKDWATLKKYCISHGYNWDRRKEGNRIAKSLAAQSGWKTYHLEGMPGNDMPSNNRTGFSGVSAGFRYDSRDPAIFAATFNTKGHKGAWWSATPVNDEFAFCYGLGFCREHLIKFSSFEKCCGYSVRLVKNR
jgi:uncharacterized protein (TIGR02145 family)